MSLMDPVPGAEDVEAFVAPASFGQERFWMMDRMDPGKTAWSVPVILRLRGPLDVRAMEAAFAGLAERHESLRTVLQWMEDGLSQVILPHGKLPLHLVELGGVPEDEREPEARRRLAKELARPFDLEAGPLARARLYRLADDHHLLLLNLHHAVTDGWSTGILLRELSALYGAFARGEPSPLSEPELQYADFAEWQREQMSVLLEPQLDWWRRALAGAPALLELPTDRPRPPVHDGRGATELFRFPAEVGSAVNALARTHGSTSFMVLLAAFQALLGRWARQDQVVVGTPVAGRTRPETRDVVGFFVNTLALRADLSGDPPFAELLRRVRETVLGAFANQDLPFEKLVDELNVPRSAAHAPVFQAMFVLQNTPDASLDFHGLQVTPGGQDAGTSPFDLQMRLTEHAGEIYGGLQYADALFDRETAQGMIGHYRTLLAAACADPSLPLSSLPLMDGDARGAVLAMGTGPERRYEDETLHAGFARQAARTPDAVALAFEGRTMTYAELDARTNQFAHRLRALGVGPEARVGVCMERGMEMVVALLGVLKAGGGYVPLDPEYPAERLAYMLADAAVPVLLTQPHLLDSVPEHGARTLAIDPAFAAIDGEPREAPADDVAPAHLAYAIYTSGSTGKPKGAMNAHRGVVNRLRWMQDEYALSADDVVLQKTPFSFDVSVWEFFWPLITGARLVLARPGGHKDPTYLADVIEREGVTTLHFVPSMLAAFVEAAPVERCHPLTRVLCSGEALPEELAQRFYARMDEAGNPRVRLHNLYGPTEAAVDVTYWPCEPGDRGPVPIGRPVANTRILVLDPRGAPTPVGVPGELHIGGVQVGRGYLGRPALTAEKFVPDPFGAPGARMYRTGDAVRWKRSASVRECVSASGEDLRVAGHEQRSQPPFTHALTHSRTHALQFLGRMDFQVKLRGFRIELGEIEARLEEHPAVRQAVAVVRQDAGSDARLVAYVVPAGEAPGVDVLRRALAQRLPEHMVPGAYVMLDALPLTPNGKVDRRALPAPEARRDLAFVEASTEAERTIAALWREVLVTDRVGVEDNFFDLGGNSLSLIRLAQKLGAAMGSTATAVDLFRFPTVRAQAAYLAADDEPEAAPAPPSAESAERARQGQNRMAMLRGMRK